MFVAILPYIEQANAYTAATKRNNTHLKEIRACLPEETSDFSWEQDLKFHAAVARATTNFFRLHVIMDIFEFTREFIGPVVEDLAGKEDNAGTIAGHHTAIFLAIKDKDPDRARETMKAHLAWTNQKLIETLKKKG